MGDFGSVVGVEIFLGLLVEIFYDVVFNGVRSYVIVIGFNECCYDF